MFSKMASYMGGGKGKDAPAQQPPGFPEPNLEQPVVFPHLAPFPYTGPVHEEKGYRYTTPAEIDFLTFRSLVDDPTGWTLRYNNDGIFAWDRDQVGEKMKLIKAFGIFEDSSPELLNDLLHDPNYRIEWDANRLDAAYLAHLAPTVDVSYYAAKVQRPVNSRDFVNMRSWRQCGNREFVILSTSVPHADMPVKAGLVRGFVKVSGYLVRPWGEKGCTVSYLSMSDPKGWIPSYLINSLTSKIAPSVITSMRNALAKYPAWIKEQGSKYERPWLQKDDTPWPQPVSNLMYEWVQTQGRTATVEQPPTPTDDDQPPSSEAASPTA